MKKSQLRKVIRETIKEQITGNFGGVLSGWTSACTPGPNCVEPTLQNTTSFGNPHLYLSCPSGFQFENPSAPPSYTLLQGGPSEGTYKHLGAISYCVPTASGGGGDVCEDFNQLVPYQQQQLCQAYSNLTTNNPSLETIGENCCQDMLSTTMFDPSGVTPPTTGSMASMPSLKPQKLKK